MESTQHELLPDARHDAELTRRAKLLLHLAILAVEPLSMNPLTLTVAIWVQL